MQTIETAPTTKSADAVNPDKIALPPDWKAELLGEFQKPYMRELKTFLKAEKAAKKTIYPPGKEIFNAFHLTPLSEVKVLILGQDPYHGPGQAHGLAFSVRKGVKPPPSLRNIFKELQQDTGVTIPENGDLTKWAEQGVLLLNTSLTVERAKAGSHQNKGWELFTDQVIRVLNAREEPVVFVLWGAPAMRKHELITRRHHLVLKSPHPSPFSADRGFFGSRPFSKINSVLKKRGVGEIDWSLE
ncbi:MAG: uracil-DNA glycosylase [Bdellovibrionia bacterium]